MRELIASLPDQLRWAAGLDTPPIERASEALVIGMGGSGIAGGIAAVVAEGCGGRVGVHKSYGVPGWARDARPLVVAVSHSGDTEETLEGMEAAAALGLAVAVVTTGGKAAGMAAERGWPAVVVPPGPQPRAAVGYLSGGVLRVLESAGVLDPQAAALRESAEVVERLLGVGDGPGVVLAEDLADALAGRVTVVYGGHGVGAVAANRWKTQINENGKAPAWWSVLPELDHNEVVGWSAAPELGRRHIGVVFLHDRDEHPKVAARSRATRRLMEDLTSIAGEVHAQGSGIPARIFSLVVVGDLVSVGIAERAGVDPMPVDAIDELKRSLEGP